jgi:hypothetical protein
MCVRPNQRAPGVWARYTVSGSSDTKHTYSQLYTQHMYLCLMLTTYIMYQTGMVSTRNVQLTAWCAGKRVLT